MRWGFQQTHPGHRAATRHGTRDPIPKILKETNRTFDSPFLPRQGEPCTSHYIKKWGLFVNFLQGWGPINPGPCLWIRPWEPYTCTVSIPTCHIPSAFWICWHVHDHDDVSQVTSPSLWTQGKGSPLLCIQYNDVTGIPSCNHACLMLCIRFHGHAWQTHCFN